MPVVPEDQRLDALRRLGLSDPLIRQSAGETLHPLFWFRCQGPPWYSYHDADPPDGPPFVPLWDCCDGVTGVWQRGNGLEFIEYDIEADGEYEVLGRTEQGLWATVFEYLHQDRWADVTEDEFRAAASVVGFRFFDHLLRPRDGYDCGTFEGQRAWLTEVVADIDRGSD